MLQIMEEDEQQYRGLSTDKLVELSMVPSKRAMKAAERAAVQEAKRARVAEIDAQAKQAREQDMLRALAEPADCGAGGSRRGKKRKSGVKRTSSSMKRRPSLANTYIDDTSSHETEDEEAAEDVQPVLVDGQQEWIIEKISSSKGVKSRNNSGGFDWVTVYKVHWVGGEVTWEPFEVVQDCSALDEFEEMQAARMVNDLA